MRALAMDPMQVRLEALKLAEHYICDLNSHLATRDLRGESAIVRVASTLEKYISEGKLP